MFLNSQNSKKNLNKKLCNQFSYNNFTMLEMIVAITIFAMIMSIAGMSLLSVRKSWQAVYTHGKNLEDLMKIDRVVDTCFRNIIPMYWTDNKTKEKKTVFTGEEDSVIFATKHRITGADYSAIRFIKLYQDEDKLIAEYRKSPILAWDENELGLKREVLAEKIEKITFLYGDTPPGDEKSKNIDWSNSWHEDKPLNYMPLAIQITVLWKDGTQEQWLRRTAGSGQFSTLGKRKKNTLKTGVEAAK